MLSWLTSLLLAAYATIPFQALAPHNSVANSVTGLMQVVETADTAADLTRADSNIPFRSTASVPSVPAGSSAARVFSVEATSTGTNRDDTSVSAEKLIRLNTATRRVESATKAIEQSARAPVAPETIRRAIIEKPRETAGVERAVEEARQVVEQAPVIPILQEREIRDVITQHEPVLKEVRADLAERDGLSLYTDSDGDSVSDYDETHIYHTDPHNPRTVPGILTDGQKILRGIDPLSESVATVPVASPRTSGIQVSDLFEVQAMRSVALTDQAETDQMASSANDIAREHTGIAFEGRALPNGFVTLYIFSTPIVVTVKADSSGRWSYELKKELEDGSHELYVAMVDNSGAIIAKSSPVPFTKQGDALEYAPLMLPPLQDMGQLDQERHSMAAGVLALFVLAFAAAAASTWRARHSATLPALRA